MCPSPTLPASSDSPPASAVRIELDRILASETFRRTERLSAFLRFIVERTLAGEGGSLKEQIIAVELYGKESDFSTAADPIVRVDARRLRDHLREYYAAQPGAAVVISLPKGSYTPSFSARVETRNAGAGAVPPAVRPRWWRGAAIAVVLATSIVVLIIAIRFDRPRDAQRLLTVTSLPGAEEDPSISPDGNFVAYSWTPHAESLDSDIWIKAVDGDATTQLTNTPNVMEKWPAWSPDGRSIAFTRSSPGGARVVVMSALGGMEQTLGVGIRPHWTPDGMSLVFTSPTPHGGVGLVRHVLKTGEETFLTSAPKGFRDADGQVSPDGGTVLFWRTGESRTAVFLKSFASEDATRITEWYSGPLGSVAFMPGGREILYPQPEVSGRWLVRMKIGDAQAVRVEGLPRESVGASVSGPRANGAYRLAVSSGSPNVGLRLVELRAPLRDGVMADSPFCEATRIDMPGRFSRDGSQLAFTSDRGGSFQVWVARRDGSGLRSLTRLDNAFVNVGSWSPDGRSIAFDATLGGNTDIYVVQVESGVVKKLTSAPASEIDPEWSVDGRWIYFSSNQSGQPAIWRIPSIGGEASQVTSEPGFEPRQSPDGRTIYFVDQRRDYAPGPPATLRAVSVEGGPSVVIPAPVVAGAWDVTEAGILFIQVRAGPASPEPDHLSLYDFGARQVLQLGQLAVRVTPAGSSRYLSASPDGRWAVVSHLIRWERDILVLENFR